MMLKKKKKKKKARIFLQLHHRRHSPDFQKERRNYIKHLQANNNGWKC